MVAYIKSLSEPWFSLVKLKLKKCEGRINQGDFAAMKTNDTITFTNDSFGSVRRYTVKITKITKYANFKEYLETEMLKRCLPEMDTIEDGLSVYYKYYTKEDEKKGIVCIRMKVIA